MLYCWLSIYRVACCYDQCPQQQMYKPHQTHRVTAASCRGWITDDDAGFFWHLHFSSVKVVDGVMCSDGFCVDSYSSSMVSAPGMMLSLMLCSNVHLSKCSNIQNITASCGAVVISYPSGCKHWPLQQGTLYHSILATVECFSLTDCTLINAYSFTKQILLQHLCK